MRSRNDVLLSTELKYSFAGVMLIDMVREEHDREDLLREATALVERIELAPAGAGGSAQDGEQIVIGFRADGAISFYFGGDTAYHFNSRGELRRAHANGLLFKAEGGKLVSLERIRNENEVQLVRRPLPDEEQIGFLATMNEQLRQIVAHSEADALVTVGRVPADADVLGRAIRWLENNLAPVVAQAPNAR